MLALSFKPVTFRPKSLICSCTFLTGFGHFHGSSPLGPIQVASTLGDRFAAVTSKLSRTQSRLSQSLYALKEFAAHLLGLHAPVTEPGFGFCQQRLEFPSVLPSKYYPGPMLLNFSVRMFPTRHGPLTATKQVKQVNWFWSPFCLGDHEIIKRGFSCPASGSDQLKEDQLMPISAYSTPCY